MCACTLVVITSLNSFNIYKCGYLSDESQTNKSLTKESSCTVNLLSSKKGRCLRLVSGERSLCLIILDGQMIENRGCKEFRSYVQLSGYNYLILNRRYYMYTLLFTFGLWVNINNTVSLWHLAWVW